MSRHAGLFYLVPGITDLPGWRLDRIDGNQARDTVSIKEMNHEQS